MESEKNRLFVVFFRPVGRNNNLHIQRNSSMKNNFSKNVFCSDNFRTMSEKFQAVWQFLFDWVVKTACYVSVGIFRGEEKIEKCFLSILVFERKFFGFLSNFYQGACKDCLLRVHSNNLKGKKIRPQKLYSTKLSQTANISGFYLEPFRRGSQNCILRVH